MSDPITEAAAALATHPDPSVRLLADRLPSPQVRAALGCIGEQAERVAARNRLLRMLGGKVTGQSTSRRAGIIADALARYRASTAWRIDRRRPVNPHAPGSRN